MLREIRDRCSTPVGVKDRFTTTWSPPLTIYPCAQRLSASKIGSQNVRITVRGQSEVLNACRRQRSVHKVGIEAPQTVTMCSTPVGVKDRFTTFNEGTVSISAGCSTPVGVKDRFTVGLQFAGVRSGSAQRLSASKIGSRESWGQNDNNKNVLNACRRQRSVHDHKGLWINGSDEGAQRLSASKIGSHEFFSGPVQDVECAQRLSASKIGSRHICRPSPTST